MARHPDIAEAVERLNRYADGDDWRGHRRTHVERMLGPVPACYGLEIETCCQEIAEFGHAGTLFGFLHESFLAAEFGPDRVNLIDEFLRRRGWQQTPRAREYLQGIRATPASLYEVHNVAPGQWIELRDLYREGPPRRIAEESGSRSAQRWDRLVARVVTAGGDEMLTGGVLPLARESAEALAGLRTHDDYVPQIADQSFLQIWLKGLLDLRRRPLPGLANTDGEPLLFTKTRLPVASSAAREIARCLDTLSGWEREEDDTPGWTWQPAAGTPRTIHATARLTDRALVIETNSRERMERALAALRAALGPLIGEALTSHEDPAQMLQQAAPRQETAAAGVPPLQGPEFDAIIRQYKDAHYRRVLDEPVPMLGGKTPRQCARTKPGRARLVRWLKDLENGELHAVGATGKGAYDFAWLWEELGVPRE
ncbi:MAG: hypothetical protein WAW79_11650 [Steroidobacteraceae bacterium]